MTDGRAPRGIRCLREFHGDPAILGYVARTSQHPFEISGGGTARAGWTTWNLPLA